MVAVENARSPAEPWKPVGRKGSHRAGTRLRHSHGENGQLRGDSGALVAMINSHAHGAGFNLALGCDLRVMADTATLAIPFAKRGIATGTNLLQQFRRHRQGDGMGATRPRALSGRGRTLGIGEPGRSSRPARTGDDGDRTRVGRGADARAWLHEVGGFAWLADTAGNRAPAPGTGDLSFATNWRFTRRASRHFREKRPPRFRGR